MGDDSAVVSFAVRQMLSLNFKLISRVLPDRHASGIHVLAGIIKAQLGCIIKKCLLSQESAVLCIRLLNKPCSESMARVHCVNLILMAFKETDRRRKCSADGKCNHINHHLR